jgi:hypothetical protein
MRAPMSEGEFLRSLLSPIEPALPFPEQVLELIEALLDCGGLAADRGADPIKELQCGRLSVAVVVEDMQHALGLVQMLGQIRARAGRGDEFRRRSDLGEESHNFIHSGRHCVSARLFFAAAGRRDFRYPQASATAGNSATATRRAASRAEVVALKRGA